MDSFEEYSKYKKRYDEFIINLKNKVCYLNTEDDLFLKNLFLESILVDVRAMLTESGRYKNNFTIQNDFRRFNRITDEYIAKNDNLEQIALQIDKYLETEVFGEGLIIHNISIREAIKFYVDKFIAHRDFVCDSDCEKKEKIKKIFLESPIFSISIVVNNILKYTEDSKNELIIKTLEVLTSRSDEDIK